MKTIRSIITIVLLIFSANLLAQKDMVTENGVRYYLHTVEKGQTLYAIGKLYKVDTSEITKANPGTDTGLSVGQVIKIPAGPEEKKEGKDIKPDTSKGFNPVRVEKGMPVHRVQKGETLFGIARQYNVDVNDILEKNPAANSGLKLEQELIIPVKTAETPVAEKPKPTASDTLHVHLVKTGETLYSIAKSYDTSPEAVLEVNPGMNESLHPGQKIRIPKAGMLYQAQTKPLEYKPEVTSRKNPGERIKLAMPLPFYLNEMAKVQSGKNEKLRQISLSMMRGSQLAADKLATMGLQAEVRVMDYSDSQTQLSEEEKTFLASADIVIGPLQREALTAILPLVKDPNTHVVCPTPQSNKVLLQRSNMSKTECSEISQMRVIAKDVIVNFPSANIVLINPGFADDAPKVEAIRSQFQKLAPNYPQLVNKSPREVIVAGRSLSGLEEKLASGNTNVIILPTSDDLLLAGFMTKLTLLKRRYDFVVYGPEKWNEMEIVDEEFKNAFNFHYATNHHVNYEAPETLAFIAEYGERFKTEPDEYAYIGYDIMLFYGLGLMEFNSLFPLNFHRIDCKMLLGSDFDPVKTGLESGYENNHAFVLQYKDNRWIPSNE